MVTMVMCMACTVHVHVTLQNFRACLKQVVNLSTLSPSSGWGEKEKDSSPQLVPHTELCFSLSSLSLHLELLAQLGLLGDDVHHLLCPLSCREALQLREHLHEHLKLLPRHVLEHLREEGGRARNIDMCMCLQQHIPYKCTTVATVCWSCTVHAMHIG